MIMKHFYLDTSALMKKYFVEAGSSKMKQIMTQSNYIYTSSLTYAETFATIYRLFREGFLNSKKLKDVIDSFLYDWNRFIIIEYTLDVRQTIPILLKKYALKGADAIHMATCVFLSGRDIITTFVCIDKRLNNAIKDSGIKYLDPTI